MLFMSRLNCLHKISKNYKVIEYFILNITERLFGA